MPAFMKSRFFKYGAPFVSLLVAASFGLKEFTQLRYTFRKSKLITPEEAEKMGVNMKPAHERPTLESEIVKLQQQQEELDTWVNIRGPRPWEDSKEVQDAQRNKMQ